MQREVYDVVYYELLDEAVIEKQVWLRIPGGWFSSDRYTQIEGKPWMS